jgi:glycosyltransferase involved in cell wall biosynthesis
MRIAAACDIGLSWRHPDMDASLELSTKVLEFGALGLPVVLNRTPMHEALLGIDYPLFAADRDDVADVIERVCADPALYRLAADRTGAAAAGYTLDRAADNLRGHLSRAFPGEPQSVAADAGRPMRVLVAGHDLKFFGRIVEYLSGLPGLEVRVDRWTALARHDSRESARLARWADVVICEWCGPVAVWYSRHKRRGTRLLVHLHRFELYSPYVSQVDIGAVDQVVCVSPQYARLTRERTGWAADKVVTIANWVDTAQLDRPKLDGAQYHLGLVGAVPSRKRMDLALDVIEQLRRDDDRYTLSVKTTMPWDHWWIWKKEEERDHFLTALRRIQRSPLLRDAVVFDKAGPDVPAWLRRVGFVLSTSDDESFHLAPAEGMASRAVPVIRDWPGAQTIYRPGWIHHTTGDMASAIGALTGAQWRESGERARQQAEEAFGLDQVCAAWRDVLTADRPPAIPDPLELLGTG